MDSRYQLEWVGSKCRQHGPYTFYTSFKFTKNGQTRVLALGEFFFVQCAEDDPPCIAEIQVLWEDLGADGAMVGSLRLYFVPEHTPDGRLSSHGKDEVVAVSNKVVMSIEDLMDWVITEEVRWIDGFPTICPMTDSSSTKENGHFDSSSAPAGEEGVGKCTPLPDSIGRDQTDAAVRDDISHEQSKLSSGVIIEDNHRDSGVSNSGEKVMVVSYTNYCRYHANLRRIGKDVAKWQNNRLLKALGLMPLPHRCTKLLFCREEFEHPLLEDDERLCEYAAPTLKGRPRKKRHSSQDDNEGYEPPSRQSCVKDTKNLLVKREAAEVVVYSRTIPKAKSPVHVSSADALARLRAEVRTGKIVSHELFLTHLYKYMKDRNTPIDRIPNLGFKQIDLFKFFKLSIQHGGYKSITSQRSWKILYDKMGGNPNSTSAATCTRKHYERLLFPFEQYLRLQARVGSNWNEEREKQKRKEKKEKKKSRVKHVREQLQELEAMRAARREAKDEFQQETVRVKVEPDTRPEDSTPCSTPASEAPATGPSASSASPSVSLPVDLKPMVTINGAHLMTMPTLVPPSTSLPLPSMVQMPSANTQFFPHVGLTPGLPNMSSVILAIPQVPVIAATSEQSSSPEGVSVSQRVDEHPPVSSSSSTVATVLDKLHVGAGMSLVQQSKNSKQEAKDRTHKSFAPHVSRQSVEKREHKTVRRAPQTGGVVCHDQSAPLRRSSPGDEAIAVSPEDRLFRPSVIKHTEHSKGRSDVRVRDASKPRVGHIVGMQPNILRLDNLNQNQNQNLNRASSDEKRVKQEMPEMPGLLGAGKPYISPYIPFLPQASFLHHPMSLLGVSQVPSTISSLHSHTRGQSDHKPPDLLSSAYKAQNVRSSPSVSAPSPPVRYTHVPIQDEPCDLTLPRKRRREVSESRETQEKHRDSISRIAREHPSSAVIRNSPVNRLRTSAKEADRHSSSHEHRKESHGKSKAASSSPTMSSSSHLYLPASAPLMAKVKMTPSPRGSITQGIINPTKNSTHSTHPLHRDPPESPKSATPESVHDLASPPHMVGEFPNLVLPGTLDASGNPLPHLPRFPIMPYSYYPLLPRAPFLPLRSPYLPAGLTPGIPTTQVESMMLQGGFVFRPPFPFPPTVPFSTAQLSVDSQHASLYRK